jgi:hypothetical protein
VDLRFLSADSNDPPLPVDGEGRRFALLWLANNADGCIAANIVLPAAAPRNVLRVTLDIARPFLWIGFVDTDGRYFFWQDSIRQMDTREAVKRQPGFAEGIDGLKSPLMRRSARQQDCGSGLANSGGAIDRFNSGVGVVILSVL